MKNQSKIVAISDTHGVDFMSLVPTCDILLLCGDISPANKAHDVATQRWWYRNKFLPQLIELKNKCGKIVFIAGNHDVFLFDCYKRGLNESEIRKNLPEGVFYLCNDSVIIDGIKIFGSPWVNAPFWADVGGAVWNFASKNNEFLEKVFADIPSDVDIIMSHGPAYGYCDQILDQGVVEFAALKYKDSAKSENLGSMALINRIKEISSSSDKNISFCSGHIHSANHAPVIYKSDIGGGSVSFICVSILNEEYKLGDYHPTVINLPNNC